MSVFVSEYAMKLENNLAIPSQVLIAQSHGGIIHSNYR